MHEGSTFRSTAMALLRVSMQTGMAPTSTWTYISAAPTANGRVRERQRIEETRGLLATWTDDDQLALTRIQGEVD
jgi:hypothetical protein